MEDRCIGRYREAHLPHATLQPMMMIVYPREIPPHTRTARPQPTTPTPEGLPSRSPGVPSRTGEEPPCPDNKHNCLSLWPLHDIFMTNIVWCMAY